MKKNIDYYPHYSNSDQHAKFKMLRVEYGWEGEGKFWALNNRIALAENCLLDVSKKYNKAALASDLDFTIKEFDSFITFLTTDCELIKETGEGVITTNIVQETFSRVMRDREEARKRHRRTSGEKNKTSGEKIDKEKESKVNKNKRKKTEGKETKKILCPYSKIVEKFNSICVTLPRVIDITDRRKNALKRRWLSDNDRQNIDWWINFFKKVDSSSFLRGDSSDFSASFDWIIKPSNMTKILEGNYDDKESRKSTVKNTCQLCAKFCVPSSPDKCHKSATIKACNEFVAR